MTLQDDSAAPAVAATVGQPEVRSSAARAGRAHKGRKLRSAWISFAGRIIAQTVGATASVMLGILVVQSYGARPAKHVEAVAQPPVVASPRARSEPGQKAIAVLPIDNFSGDPAQEHVADGLTETLIADLSQAGTLRVISRTSSMRYKEQRPPLTGIARDLDVDLVLEGSIVRSGPRLRVVAQLIDGHTDEHLWARSFDRAVESDVDAVAQIASDIARDLVASISREQ